MRVLKRVMDYIIETNKEESTDTRQLELWAMLLTGNWY